MERRDVEKPTKQRFKKVCVICKLATGDYFGAVQDLSMSNVTLDRLLRPPWSRSS